MGWSFRGRDLDVYPVTLPGYGDCTPEDEDEAETVVCIVCCEAAPSHEVSMADNHAGMQCRDCREAYDICVIQTDEGCQSLQHPGDEFIERKQMHYVSETEGHCTHCHVPEED